MLFAGAFAFQQGATIPIGLKAELEHNLSRKPRAIRVHDQKSFFFVSTGIHHEPAYEVDSLGELSALSGNPLIFDRTEMVSKHHQLALMREAARDKQMNMFCRARGTYCFIYYNPSQHRLWLVADHIGLCPIYYTSQKGVFIFASALRVLEAATSVYKRLSLEGMAELCGVDCLLGDRTPYENIFVLRECEVMETTDRGERRLSYDDWIEPEQMSYDMASNTTRLMSVFQEAIDLRLNEKTRAYAYLSGGLDSRSIVTALLARGVEVTALNFSPKGSQDHAFAEGFAQSAGPLLRLHCFNRGANPNFSLLAAQAMASLNLDADFDNSIWSGDGGSVGLGHVYMDEAMVDRLETGDLEGTARLFLKVNRLGLPLRIFTGSIRTRLQNYLENAVVEELKRRPRRDRARSLYMFLLFNDQRRHLFKHFETMDEHGLEFNLPFFDASFLKAVSATPIRSGILHRLYMSWFERFPMFSRESPWQTYPGHVPCPLKTGESLNYQWAPLLESSGIPERFKIAQSILKSLGAQDLPPHIFSKRQLAVASLAHLSGTGDFGYVLDIVRQFQTHFGRCNADSAHGIVVL